MAVTEADRVAPNPIWLARSKLRRRRFDECVDICTAALDKNPYDQAGGKQWMCVRCERCCTVTPQWISRLPHLSSRLVCWRWEDAVQGWRMCYDVMWPDGLAPPNHQPPTAYSGHLKDARMHVCLNAIHLPVCLSECSAPPFPFV